jgi:hypothetical protein
VRIPPEDSIKSFGEIIFKTFKGDKYFKGLTKKVSQSNPDDLVPLLALRQYVLNKEGKN